MLEINGATYHIALRYELAEIAQIAPKTAEAWRERGIVATFSASDSAGKIHTFGEYADGNYQEYIVIG
jgi:hypothetical protein